MKTCPDDDSTEPVGYARPPKDTRYKKGVSGNPSGRPKAPITPQKMTQAILQQPLRSKKGRKLKRIRQDQMMLQTALDAVASVKAARLIFGIAYPQEKANAPHITKEVLADLHELRSMQQSDLTILPTDTAHEASRKWSLFLKIGDLEARIEQAIAHIPLPLEEDDE